MIRLPAVAGSFYPDDPTELIGLVDAMLDAAPASPADAMLDEAPASPADGGRAYLVPHAGYRYSGPTAAHVYARLRQRADVDRVVLIGPAHFVLLSGCAVPAADMWQTPLGDVEIDADGARELAASGLATVDDRPHRPEHSIEVQLPFLQRALGTFRVLPIAVGVCDVDTVARVLSAVMDGHGDRTVLICSSDLSHYLDEATANARDGATLEAVTGLAPRRIGVRDACGVYALRGLLGWARATGLAPRVLHRCTSGQATGDFARVVGYAAAELTATER